MVSTIFYVPSNVMSLEYKTVFYFIVFYILIVDIPGFAYVPVSVLK